MKLLLHGTVFFIERHKTILLNTKEVGWMKVKSTKIVRYHMNNSGELCCTICGALVNITRFKNGYICNSCLQFVKSHY